MRIGPTIYLDHQATTPVDKRVIEAILPYLDQVFGNPHSAEHALGWSASKAVEEASLRIANFSGVDPDEVIYTSGATEANNLALLGLCRRSAGSNRNRVLFSSIEHKSVLSVMRTIQEQLGLQVEKIPVDAEGRISLPHLAAALDERVLLVSIMAVNNEIGTIQRMTEIGGLVRATGAVLHCDAAQASCAIDVQSLTAAADLLSLSGHKMYGPKGVGALIARRDLHSRIEPIIYGGGQQGNIRSGTIPVPLCVGMGVAAELLRSEEGVRERQLIQRHRDYFIDRLARLNWATHLNGPTGADRHPGNVNVRFDGFMAQDILGALQPHVAASSGSACTSGVTEPSHVLRAIGLTDRAAESSIRFSIGRRTTTTDIDDTVTLLNQVLSRLPLAA